MTDTDPAAGDEFSSLRDILLGPAAGKLDDLHARLTDPEIRAKDVGDVLPRVLVRHADDPALTRALTPPLERAITASVKRNPVPLADALFPVMGPAIRKAVAAGLASTIESVNRTLEYSLSWRSIQWRLEALRTHRTFAEIVLSKTLLYRVEQVFLIDRRTGLLLQHVKPGTATVADADMVSGMLTAIRDFVQDSFKVGASESLETLQVGDLSVWIEAGPHAMIAAVIRGTAPRDLRPMLQRALEEIHMEFGAALDAFDGDTTPFARARPILETCLTSEYRTESRSRRGAWILFALVLAAILVWAGFAVALRMRVGRFLDAVDAAPGLTAISSTRTWTGRYIVTGLRDPLAANPEELLGGAGLTPAQVETRWTPYQSLEHEIVVARASAALRLPAGARLALTDGVLSVTGPVTLEWIANAERLAPVVGGVTRFDTASAAQAIMRDAASRIEAINLLFVQGTPILVPGQEDARGRLLDALGELDAAARLAGTQQAIEIVGHTDAAGAEASNMPLSLARAEVVRALATSRALPHLTFEVAGAGSRTPIAAGTSEADYQRNRRVSFRVRAGVPR